MSDNHSPPSLDVWPIPGVDDKTRTPKLHPRRLTETDPVDAELELRILLVEPVSHETESETLDCRRPAVKVNNRLPAIPCPILLLIAESDVHSLLSHELSPRYALGVLIAELMPDPKIVTLIDPLATRLILCAVLKPKMSLESISVKLLKRIPAETNNR